MIRRNYLGLDVTANQLRGVSMYRRGRAPVVNAARVQSLAADVLEPGLREPMVLDTEQFVAAVKETLDPLSGKEDRIALSLPDGAGRVLLLEVETAFKSHSEGIEVIKWQLKGNLPAEAKDIQLDYQVLEKTETGRYRLMVSLIVKPILYQLEELLGTAGYHAELVDFHALNLYNYYRSRLDLGEDFIFVAVEGGNLLLQFFQGRIPLFHRTKKVAADPAQVFQEVNLSFAGLQQAHPGVHRPPVFLHSDWENREALVSALKSAFDREVHHLEPRIERIAGASFVAPTGNSEAIAAAVGATERLL